MENILKKKLTAGDVTFGVWVSLGSPNVLDVLKELSFDWFLFDMEHSPISIETVNAMMQVLNGSRASPLVRVGEVNQALIKLVLDTGSHGVILPLINTVEEAEKAVRFAKYPPQGVRGVAGTKASAFGLNLGKYLRAANDETMLIAQAETPQAIDSVNEIAEVNGIDVIFVGPSDLTSTMGLIDDRTNPKVAEMMARVVEACNEHGKAAGVMAVNLAEAKIAVDRGFRFIALGSDARYLLSGADSFLKSVGKN